MAKLKVSVNKNPTKEGIKVQFVLPETLEGDAKTEATQKLQSKLNQGLSQYNLTVSQDTDVPYSNVIGFLIPIADIKLLIKNAMGGETQAEPAPEEAPAPEMAPEEPMKEIKRMQELAGLINENRQEVIEKVKEDLLASELKQDAEKWFNANIPETFRLVGDEKFKLFCQILAKSYGKSVEEIQRGLVGTMKSFNGPPQLVGDIVTREGNGVYKGRNSRNYYEVFNDLAKALGIN
jgi:hypothetical protein